MIWIQNQQHYKLTGYIKEQKFRDHKLRELDLIYQTNRPTLKTNRNVLSLITAWILLPTIYNSFTEKISTT